MVQIDIYEIDTIDAGEYCSIVVDGAIDRFPYHPTSNPHVCGGPSGDNGIYTYKKNFTHSSHTLTIKLSSNLDSAPGDESYAFRNIRITTFNEPRPMKICSRTCKSKKFDLATRTCLFPKHCQEIFIRNKADPNGVFIIEPANGKKMTIFCQDGVTLFQKRIDGTTDFYLPWADYVNGFGDPATNFWLGLDNLFLLTNQKSVALNASLVFLYTKYFGLYLNLSIGDATSKYVMWFSCRDSSSTINDCFIVHKNMEFSTYDRDNDYMIRSCPQKYKGG